RRVRPGRPAGRRPAPDRRRRGLRAVAFTAAVGQRGRSSRPGHDPARARSDPRRPRAAARACLPRPHRPRRHRVHHRGRRRRALRVSRPAGRHLRVVLPFCGGPQGHDPALQDVRHARRRRATRPLVRALTMNPTRLLLLIVVLLAVGGGAWMLLNSDHTPSAPIEEPVATTTTEDKPPETGALSAQHGEQTEQAPAPARSEVKVDRSKRESQWGFFGKVVAPTGVPVKDCKVFLVESAQGTELFRFMQLAQRGVTLPPVASGATDEQGQFRLGVETFDPNKAFEVRVVSNDYADKAQGGLRLTTDAWVDAGVLQLEPGITVSGQGTVAGSAGMPIADAQVSLQSNLPFELSVVPGRERGIVVRTDASGFYRATNVPPGVHTLSAVAPNYARLTIPNVTVNPQSPVTQNFELSPGLSIQGRVIDGTGQGVARARVVAVAMSSKTPVTGDTFTDENGGFEILGLLDGPYQLTAKAEGFVDANEKPISAGTKDVQLVGEKQ